MPRNSDTFTITLPEGTADKIYYIAPCAEDFIVEATLEKLKAEEPSPEREIVFLWYETDGNIRTLHTIDNRIRATVTAPEGASRDYGYLAMKDAINAAYTGEGPLGFVPDGEARPFAKDASDGIVTVTIT
jgi:hypothetical protein